MASISPLPCVYRCLVMYAPERNKNRLTRAAGRSSSHLSPRVYQLLSGGTLLGVAKTLIKVRLATKGRHRGYRGRFAGWDEAGIPGAGRFIKRDLIRGCQDPFRVCFRLVSTEPRFHYSGFA